MLEFVQRLCRAATGTKCSQPRLTKWKFVDAGAVNASVDIPDVASGGLTMLAPTNVKVYGGHFSTGLIYDSPNGGMSTSIRGYGAGAGGSVGIAPPFLGLSIAGKVTPQAVAKLTPIKRKVIETFGGSLQGFGIEKGKGKIPFGVGAGSYIVAGPDTNGSLSLYDFNNVFATVVSLGANFGFNGVNGAVIIMSKRTPVLTTAQIPWITAVGAIAGIGLAASCDIEASGIVYKLTFG